MVSKQKVSDEAARSINFMVQKTFGVAAVQWSKQGSGGAFPSSSQSTHEELSAGFNQIYSTVELEYDLWQRALNSPHKYAEPLAIEIQSKGIAQKRLLSAAFHLDGSGSLGQIHATTSPTAVSTNVSQITLSSGAARYCEFGDILKFVQADGDAFLATTSSVAYVVVLDKSRENDTINVTGYTSSDVVVTAANLNTDIDRAENASCYIYRNGQDISTGIDQATGFAGIEMNNLAEIMPGLPSLTANDGRLMHGMTMSGVTSGTKYSCSSAAVDISHLQAGLDKLKTIVGQGSYKYRQALCAPETLSAFIESNETDRRLINVSDNKRGQAGFGYIHGNDTLELATSEFNAPASIWVIPEGSKQSGILELHGKDFVEVKAGNQSEFLKASGSGGYSPYIQKFMSGCMTLLCKRPNAILEIKDFTV